MTHWQSCISWQDVKATFTLDYYFTTQGLKTLGESTPEQIPVRAEVKGVKGEQGDRTTFHHIYEYMSVRAFDRLPAETFSLPDFMVCAGQSDRWTHDLPSLPESMSYILERVSGGPKINKGQVGIDVVSVFTDAKRKLVRTDHMETISISDFNTGVQYIIDQNGCYPGPISPLNVVSASEENGLVKMKDRPEVGYLKGQFRFTGPKLFREISALGFAGKAPDRGEVLQAYVTSNDRKLLGVVVKNNLSKLETYYNIFNFVDTAYPSHDDRDPFDIRRCIDSNKITEFDITVKYESSYEGDIKDWSAEIIAGLRDYTARTVGCSVLQISKKDYHINANEQEFQWSGFFLGSIPNLSRAKVENQLPVKTYEEFVSTLFQSIQNGRFVEKISIGEGGYFVSVVGKNLKTKGADYQPVGVRETPLSKFSNFNGFCVKTFSNVQKKLVLNSAYECAKNCLASQWMGCNVFQYSKSTKECTMSMHESLPALARTPGCDFYILKYLSHFERFPGQVLLEQNDALFKQASTAEVCARQCLQEDSYKCESFDFCDEEDRCQLSTNHYYDKDSNPSFTGEQVVSCTHYSRKSLDDFTSVRSTDLTLPGLTEVEAESLQECAYLCQNDCAMFSSCLVDQRLVCKFVQASAVGNVKYEYDLRCSVHNAPDAKSKISKAKNSTKTSGKTARSNSSKSYSGGAMAGLGIAMVLTGAGVGVVTILLLRYFKIWNGF